MLGSLTMALVSVLAPLPAQVALLGALVSILAGLFLSYLEQEEERERRRAQLLEKVRVPVELAPEHELFDHYSAYSAALIELAKQTDPILRASALLKLASVTEQVKALAESRLVFSSTEAWRTVYEQLLQSRDIQKYRSVAWVKTRDYWQDQPGRQSLAVNFEASHRGTLIERIVILRDDLWRRSQLLPSADILPWIEEQHSHGIWITLVREADIASEPDLLADVGIYGERAVGVQELDERSRTVRFLLCFDPPSVRLALDRWQRLSVYAVPYRDLLDQLPPGA
ncbi:MAG: hypothetical protein L0Z62_10875 [Gemmataceae bacterium]|nr:hypothetical protein [Gemmataceae bacterium]